MEPIFPIFIVLLLLLVPLACCWFVVSVIKSHRRRTFTPTAGRQSLVFAQGMLLFAVLGSFLIAPTGPGSGTPFFVAPLLPCLLFLIIGPRFSRLLAVLTACGLVVGIMNESREKRGSLERMRLRQESKCEKTLSHGIEPRA